MNKINLNKPFKELDGETMKNCMADTLANRLYKGSDNDYLKFVELSQKLYKTKILEVDNSDLEKVKTKIKEKGPGSFFNFVKEQLLKEIKEQSQKGS